MWARISYAFLFAFALTNAAFAFPEMVRHGYGQCIACHHAPTGGGLITNYGRELSRELLAWKSGESESQFAYGVVELPDWLSLGGDVRAVQVLVDTHKVQEGRFIFMQADLEAAATIKKFTLQATGGIDYGNNFISRRHFLTFQPSEEIWLRSGRFYAPYGLQTVEHTLFIRRGIDFQDQSSETYNVEASYIGKEYAVHTAAIIGRPEDEGVSTRGQTSSPERGEAFSASHYFGKRFRAGLSYFHGKYRGLERHLAGPFAALGFTKRLFLLGELNYESRDITPSRSTQGVSHYFRLNYEPLQGFNFYGLHQNLRRDFSNSRTAADAYGIGTQLFPRPHFEIQGEWQKMRAAGESSDFFQLMMHFYL